MRVVGNTGPIVWLASLGLLEPVISKRYGNVYVPPEVYRRSIACDKANSYSRSIRRALKNKLIIMRRPNKCSVEIVRHIERELGVEIGDDDREAVALAIDLKADILMVNDELVAEISRIIRVKPRGILFILLEAVRAGIIDAKHAESLILRMVRRGFSPPLETLISLYKVLVFQ